jgi:hypothetical protein
MKTLLVRRDGSARVILVNLQSCLGVHAESA